MHLEHALLFFRCLATGLLFSSFSFETQALSLGEFSTTLSLSTFLSFALFFDFEAELLFLFFLFLDDSQVVFLLLIFFSSTRLLAIGLFVVLGVDGGVVLVLTTTTLTFLLASHQLITFVDLTREEIALLTVQLPHEVLLTLVSLYGHLIDRVLLFRFGVDVVFEATDHVGFGEVVFTIVLGDLAR